MELVLCMRQRLESGRRGNADSSGPTRESKLEFNLKYSLDRESVTATLSCTNLA